MKNIKLSVNKPYNDKSEYKSLVSFEAEFDDEEEAFNFNQKLNDLIIRTKREEKTPVETEAFKTYKPDLK